MPSSSLPPFRPRGIWAALLLVLLMPAAAFAADARGQFALKGVAVLGCRQFVEARGGDAVSEARFRSWLDGYLTATNRYEQQTYDIAPWGTGEVLAVIIENHCRQNLDEPFGSAVQRLVITLKEDRLVQGSTLRTVTAGGRSTQIYDEMLRRVQLRLADRGLYAGQADGVFGPQTEQAIATFQISEGMDGTGLPDPLTVWKLVRP